MFFVNEWTRQGDCLTLFLVVIAAGRRSAQRRTLAEHGECSLMMRGDGLQRSGVRDRTSTDAVKRVTDIEQGRSEAEPDRSCRNVVRSDCHAGRGSSTATRAT